MSSSLAHTTAQEGRDAWSLVLRFLPIVSLLSHIRIQGHRLCLCLSLSLGMGHLHLCCCLCLRLSLNLGIVIALLRGLLLHDVLLLLLGNYLLLLDLLSSGSLLGLHSC